MGPLPGKRIDLSNWTQASSRFRMWNGWELFLMFRNSSWICWELPGWTGTSSKHNHTFIQRKPRNLPEFRYGYDVYIKWSRKVPNCSLPPPDVVRKSSSTPIPPRMTNTSSWRSWEIFLGWLSSSPNGLRLFPQVHIFFRKCLRSVLDGSILCPKLGGKSPSGGSELCPTVGNSW